MKSKIIIGSFLIIAVFLNINVKAQNTHPSLAVSSADIRLMKDALGKYPLFDQAYSEAKDFVEKALARPIEVPVPIDVGGYTHERHNQNHNEMQFAGILFQMTNDERYAVFIRDMLLKYADLYPTLGRHPKTTSTEYGRLYWQVLDENVWLVHAAQAYDYIYDWLKESDRILIEKNLFRPMVNFFINEQSTTIDRIHNHGTWMVASIGMLGYALRDRNLIDIALYGSKKDKKAGFLRQMDLLFSPDGYYTEGPYYSRYAIVPFILFSEVIQHNQPELSIYEYRNQILRKAVSVGFQLTDSNGRYIPLNDASKGMSILTNAAILTTDHAFANYGNDPELIPIIQKQNKVTLDGPGLAVAKVLNEEKVEKKFKYRSVEYTDGANGDEGGIGILHGGRDDDQSMLVMKYSAQGLRHGHFDKLTFLFYDQNREIIQDYGAVRFVSVEPKFGGRYLPETETWCKQTIAHNTLIVDEKSHYDGIYNIAKQHHADRFFFSASDPNIQVMSAKALDVYKDVSMQRTMAMITDPDFPKPVVIDIFRVISNKTHQYDLPFYYMGHLISTNVNYKAFDSIQEKLGSSNGYQHLWREAEGIAKENIKVTWLNGERYYSIVSAADTSSKVIFTRIGATDPNFNLRNEPGFIIRRNSESTVFASAIEQHGSFNPVQEYSSSATGKIKSIKVLSSTDEASIIEILGDDSLHWIFAVVNSNASDDLDHTININGKSFVWKGNYKLWKN